MTAVLDRVPVERIRSEASKLTFAATLLTLFALVFWVAGWLIGRAWAAVAWSVAAVKVGFADGRARAPDGGG